MENLDWQTLYYALATGALVGSFLLAGLSMRLKRDFITKDDFKAASDSVRRDLDERKERLDRHHDRIAKLEGLIQHLPTEKGFFDLAIAMQDLRGEIKAAGERMGSFGRDLNRMDRALTRHEDILSEAARGGAT